MKRAPNETVEKVFNLYDGISINEVITSVMFSSNIICK